MAFQQSQTIPKSIAETIAAQKIDINWNNAVVMAEQNMFPFNVPVTLFSRPVVELAYHQDELQKERVFQHRLDAIQGDPVEYDTTTARGGTANKFLDSVEFSNLNLYSRLQTGDL